MKTGKTDKILFSKPSYVTTGDPFIQVGLQTMGRSTVKDGHLKAGHERAFKPAKDPGIKVDKPPYEYIHLGPGPKKNFKDAEGHVMIGPRNILTNPMKEGKVGKNTSFGGNIPYLPDDYDAIKKLATKEREHH
jgi:hypothetical protein